MINCNRNVVLTAAHCLVNSTKIEIFFGHSNSTSDKVISSRVEKTLIHPNFTENDNDIALLKLEENLVFSDSVQPIALPQEIMLTDPDVLKVQLELMKSIDPDIKGNILQKEPKNTPSGKILPQPNFPKLSRISRCYSLEIVIIL